MGFGGHYKYKLASCKTSYVDTHETFFEELAEHCSVAKSWPKSEASGGVPEPLKAYQEGEHLFSLPRGPAFLATIPGCLDVAVLECYTCPEELLA
jgi:hypothetical protein